MILKNILIFTFFLVTVKCEYGEFDNHLLSGKLIIVVDGICNNECREVIEKVSKFTSEYYIADITKDKRAKSYLNEIRYAGPFPIYFYKSIFLSNVNHDQELASLLKDL